MKERRKRNNYEKEFFDTQQPESYPLPDGIPIQD